MAVVARLCVYAPPFRRFVYREFSVYTKTVKALMRPVDVVTFQPPGQNPRFPRRPVQRAASLLVSPGKNARHHPVGKTLSLNRPSAAHEYRMKYSAAPQPQDQTPCGADSRLRPAVQWQTWPHEGLS